MSTESLLWVHEDVAAARRAEGLTDYKFMCFGGEVRCVFTCTGRAEGDLRVDFFDTEWNHLPFTRHYPNADVVPRRPLHLLEMAGLAEELSADIPFVRVDFYEQSDRVLFGEMTFYPGSGFEEFEPEEWDLRIGNMLSLEGAYCPPGRQDVR